MVGTTPSPFCPGLRPPSFQMAGSAAEVYLYIYVCTSPPPKSWETKLMVDYIGNHGSMTGRDPSKAVNESPLMKISGSTIA